MVHTTIADNPQTPATPALQHHHGPSGLHYHCMLVLLASTLHSLRLAPTPPTQLLLHTPHSTVSYFFRLIVTCPIALLLGSAKVGYSTLQSKAQTAGASTRQTLRGV